MSGVLCVYRAERFSPNSVDRDRAVMDAVALLLAGRGIAVKTVGEEQLRPDREDAVVLTMARSAAALDVLERMEAQGCTVINAPGGVRRCARSTVDRLMRSAGIPAAPLSGSNGYWIKRGDEAAQERGDVVHAADEAGRDAALERFRARGIKDVVVTAHVEGDLVKFYGVGETGFFRTFYPGDGLYSKFGDELVNGRPVHYRFPADDMKRDAGRLASLVGVDVYGGDCIVRRDGTYAFIDFNDWPSFAMCRNEAAEAIAKIVCEKVKRQ